MRKTAIRSTAGSRYRIECKFAERVLVPSEAIERAFYENARPWTEDLFVTLDGKLCRPEFLITWLYQVERWQMKFGVVRSLWFDRLQLRSGLRSWHYIRLYELE